jgi:hypothetical protein
MTRDGGRLHKVLCDVVAFANTRGGTVYVGVSATRKTASRGVDNPEGAVVFLKKELERNIVPQLDARVDIVQSLGASIVRVTVPSGPDKPYAVNQTQIYVRQEGETSEAVRDEIVQLVLGGRQAAAIAEVEQTLGPVSAEAKEPVILSESDVQPPAYLMTDLPLPSIGVEIIASEERQGARYFTIRDLRNGSTVQNVTAASARKLWSYAITQYLTHPVDPAAVTWRGEFGLWKAERRAKKLRYDLAVRQADAPGGLRVFYGVTEDGMTGPWAHFLKAEVTSVVEVDSDDEAEENPEGEVEVAPKAKSRRRRSRGGGRREAPVEGEAKAEAEVEVEVKPEAKPKASTRGRKPTPQAGVETKVEVQAETPAAVPAEVKPKASTRGQKPKVQAVAKSAAKAEVEAKAEVQAEAPVEAPTVVSAETKPKTASRRRKSTPKAEDKVEDRVEAKGEAEAPIETAEGVPVEVKPKPRTRSRKPKTQPEAGS